MKDAFEQRDLLLVGSEELPADFHQANGVIFALGDKGRDDVIAQFAHHAVECIDTGLLVQVLADSDAAMGKWQTATTDAQKAMAGMQVGTQWKAEVLARSQVAHIVGPRPNFSLQINEVKNRPPLAQEDTALLRRAFNDCSAIDLVELSGGLSDARVFAAYMTIIGSDAGKWPQPAFVKLDRLDKVKREADNYKNYADRYIPFGLRPNIQQHIWGHSRGLLRGNFVDKSESLSELIERNMASHAITHLFNDTLSGWHDQAYGQDPVQGSIAEAMELAGIVKPAKIKPSYVDFAKAEGEQMTPDEMWDKLKGLKQTYRKAPCHGDLHAENVRVQDNRAILIDMASVAIAPITSDIAALETWVAFQPPKGCNQDDWADHDWAELIDGLYAKSGFVRAPEPPDPTSKFCGLTNVVRQLRALGLAAQTEEGEYQTAVAVHLLRRCQWEDGKTHDVYRRAKGFLIAAQLVRALAAGKK
jgi:hypothetical protein